MKNCLDVQNSLKYIMKGILDILSRCREMRWNSLYDSPRKILRNILKNTLNYIQL